MPVNTSPPQITGTPQVGHVLSCSQGTWTNNPTSFAYKWNRDGTAITGATSSSYTVVSADAGRVAHLHRHGVERGGERVGDERGRHRRRLDAEATAWQPARR